MTGSGLAQLIIPIAGTLFLTAGLALVFYADCRPWRVGGTPAPGHEIPARPRWLPRKTFLPCLWRGKTSA
jgi:hypothetical protein